MEQISKFRLGLAGLAISLVLQFAPFEVGAQVTDADWLKNALKASGDKQKLNFTNFDFAVPDSPLLVVMGLTPQSTPRVTNPREFAALIAPGVDQNGNEQTSIGFDTSPYLLLAGDKVTLQKYRTNQTVRQLARTQLSFVAAKGTGDEDESLKVGLGLRLTPWDRGDARMSKSLSECFHKTLKLPTEIRDRRDDLASRIFVLKGRATLTSVEQAELAEKTKQWGNYDPTTTELKKFSALNHKAAETCRKDFAKKHWNASSLGIGIAPTFISKKGDLSGVESAGIGAWATLSYGFEDLISADQEEPAIPGLNFDALLKNMQLIFHARYRANEQAPVSGLENKFIEQDSTLFGARLRIDGGDLSLKALELSDLKLSIEGAYISADRSNGVDDSYHQLAVAAEIGLGDGFWFQLAGGQNINRDSDDDTFVISTFKWGFSTPPDK
tara:strand:+ start:713 stop:2035 length:1323 start_codon:yes stop_codon:yes gene_type:complete